MNLMLDLIVRINLILDMIIGEDGSYPRYDCRRMMDLIIYVIIGERMNLILDIIIGCKMHIVQDMIIGSKMDFIYVRSDESYLRYDCGSKHILEI